MAANSTVLREYLVSLGFKVDQTQAKRFDDGLARWDKRANALAKSLTGMAVAAVGAVAVFAYSMEKLYFASKRTDSAVGSIQALEYGASRVGVSGDSIRQSLEAMSRNMRANPGLQGLLESLGVRVTGRDKADVLTDLVSQLNKMPFYVAQQYASLFGIDPDQLFMLQQGLEEFRKAQEQRKQWAADMGVDADAAAASAHELVNQWREATEKVLILRDAVLQHATPALVEMAKVVGEMSKDWARIVQDGDAHARTLEGLGLKPTGGGVELSKESKARLGMSEDEGDTYEGTNLGTGEKYTIRKNWLDRQMDKLKKWGGAKTSKAPLADQASVDAAQDDAAFKQGGRGPLAYAPNGRGGFVYQPRPAGEQGGDKASQRELIRRLEQQYGLPEGVLARVWKAESGEGAAMTSPAGAKGHFGFMDATGRQYGLDREGGRADRDDLAKSADAAGQMWSYLLKKYAGDVRRAAAAYNWGEGNVDAWQRTGRGMKGQPMPAETRDYMDRVALGASPRDAQAAGAQQGAQITQTNNVTVSGVSDPQRAAVLTREQIDQSNADVVRNLNSQRIN